MLASIDPTALKVLTPTLAQRLQVFNQAARALQFMGIRLLSMSPEQNRLTIAPQSAKRLLDTQQLSHCQHSNSAGSTRHTAQFQGVTLHWRTPISAARPQDWATKTLH